MIFATKPTGFQHQIEVVSCYVEHNGKILLLQRHNQQSHGAKWGLPAGKMRPQETKEMAMQRELREETGLAVNLWELSYRELLYVQSDKRDLLYHVFHLHLGSEPGVTINDYEHQAFQWVQPEEALKLDYIHDLDACLERHYLKQN